MKNEVLLVFGCLTLWFYLALRGAPAPTAPPAAPTPPPAARSDGKHSTPLSERQLVVAGQQTRLVACGDSRLAVIIGNDVDGQVVPGGQGTCTIVFAAPWVRPPHCVVYGGDVVRSLATELVVSATQTFTYHCDP